MRIQVGANITNTIMTIGIVVEKDLTFIFVMFDRLYVDELQRFM